MTLWIFAVLAGLMAWAGVYLMLARQALRLALGLTLLGGAANLVVFAVSGATQRAAPFVPVGATAPAGPVADPLPQALVLTAIVIGFGLSVFALALAAAARRRLGTDDVEAMRAAEPLAEPHA
jgi:multicomponent Na+:H+ antiporter subunit C